MPRSLMGRLCVTALVATGAALLLAAVSVGHVLERFVMHGLDERLDTQLTVIARAVRPDGSLDPSLAADVPPFDRPGSGWAWQIVAPGGVLRSASLGHANLPLPPDRRREARPGERPRGPVDSLGTRPQPVDGVYQDGTAVHGRRIAIPTSAGLAQLIAVGPREIVDQPLREAIAPLLLSLLLLASFLLAAIVIQLRFGLRPLQRLRAMVEAVRAGQLRQVSIDEPTELLPLVAELNALILTNEQTVAQARGHVANLAHGLKTPLATLRLEMQARGEDGQTMVELIDRMDRQIRHHLGRARAAETGRALAPSLTLAEPVTDLMKAMAAIHAGRGIDGRIDMAADLRARCDPQDLDELIGNLLDNAWRHAHATVLVEGARMGRMTTLSIVDDGPGMTEAQITEALIKGRRLDETEPGHGFGLAISRELAELHGGSVKIEPRSPAGPGLRVTITLPAD